MKPSPVVLAFALVAGSAAFAAAPSPGPAAVIKARMEHYKEIGKSMKGVFDELKSSSPSVPKIQGYAKVIDLYAPQVPSWFPKGSGHESGIKTAAKAEIWNKPADFAKAADAFKIEAAAFDATAQKGDIAAIGAEARKLGGTCKSCHDQFKDKEER